MFLFLSNGNAQELESYRKNFTSANDHFDSGEFDKALIGYQKIMAQMESAGSKKWRL